MKEAVRNHTYVIEQNGRQSREAESRLKAYNLAENPAGKIPTLVEPNRQFERPEEQWGDLADTAEKGK